MNEKVEEPQEQAAERSPIHPKLLRKILEAHRKWVESEGKEGERADLVEANLQAPGARGPKRATPLPPVPPVRPGRVFP